MAVVLTVLAGCAAKPGTPRDLAKPDSAPTSVPTAPGTLNDQVDYAEDGSVIVPSRGNKSPYTVLGKTYEVMPSSLGYLEIGIASWYGRKFHGRLTSNGETYDMFALSAAHKALPLPTFVRVTNLDNGQKVILRVNDRGPFHSDRVIDLSFEAARQLGFNDKGIAPVVVEAVNEMNFPEKFTEVPEHEHSFYLQLGVFASEDSAGQLQRQVTALLSEKQLAHIGVRILQSERDDHQILHKVWLGPLASKEQQDELGALLEASEFGRPYPVEIQ